MNRCLGFIGLLLWPLLGCAEPYLLRIDPVHTRIAFLIEHLGISRAIGTFSTPEGEVRFDPEDWSSGHVRVEIPLESLDLGDATWRRRTLSHSLLNAKKQPVARFESTAVQATGMDTARVEGQLSLRGQTVPVVLDVHFNGHRRNPYNFKDSWGFSATATLSRKAFGMSAFSRVVGDAVEVRIEVEASPMADKLGER